MIIENAFGYMPEVLTGSNYAAQRYEGGIVTAAALAVLQELNARNAPNPLSNICVEKLYEPNGFDRGNEVAKRRYLRADMHVDLSRLWVGSESLSRFGWRYKNWLEAKFFRKGKIPSTTACAHLAADLIRLCALVPPEHRMPNAKGFFGPHNDATGHQEHKNLCTGRYLLHVYDSSPEDLVGQKGRPWVRALRTPGSHKIKFKVSEDKAKKNFVGKIGDVLGEVELDMRVTNFCRAQTPSSTQYYCALSRIDAFRIALKDGAGAGTWWDENEKREGQESGAGAWKKIRDLVGAFILLGDKKDESADDQPPSIDELSPADGALVVWDEELAT